MLKEKKILCFAAVMLNSVLSLTSAAQNTFPSSGNVGIGTVFPGSPLHVNGNARIGGNLSLQRASDNASREINAYSDNHGLFINASVNGPGIEMYGRYSSITDRRGAIRFVSYGSTGEGIGFLNYDPVAATWRRTMAITNENKVYIGTDISNTPGTYKLYVEGGILTEKVRVAVKGTASWADHVFAPEYQLMPLGELQSYISENKHLPEIPSAQEVVNEGVDLGQMNAKLLQKIEELTLYIIQQQKEIEELKKSVTTQE